MLSGRFNLPLRWMETRSKDEIIKGGNAKYDTAKKIFRGVISFFRGVKFLTPPSNPTPPAWGKVSPPASPYYPIRAAATRAPRLPSAPRPAWVQISR